MMLCGHTIQLIRHLLECLHKLIYGKAYHLPIEIEHKAYWAIKALNYDCKKMTEKRLLQLNELEELREMAYENSKTYKECTKK